MGTTVAVEQYPLCDLCRLILGKRTDATYDVRTNTGQWANLCEDHFLTDAMSHELGTGRGQRLVLESAS